ncbi:MAG: riboflavin synthase [Candidatus Zixiibacteriota bacterium]
MFTGLVETVGTIKRLRKSGNYRVVSITTELGADELRPGESISCDGACLTVVSVDKNLFVVEASQETARRTILSTYRVGSKVNLERALRADSRLGGHFVTGHIDDTGVVDTVRPGGDSLELAIQYDAKYDNLVIEKGSIAVNGVSLTVNDTRSGWFHVNLIPFTVKKTTLGRLKTGDRVNLEFDMIGKYLQKMKTIPSPNTLSVEKLIESGW